MREAEAAFESLLCNPSASHVSFKMNSRITICLLQFDFEEFFFLATLLSLWILVP